MVIPFESHCEKQEDGVWGWFPRNTSDDQFLDLGSGHTGTIFVLCALLHLGYISQQRYRQKENVKLQVENYSAKVLKITSNNSVYLTVSFSQDNMVFEPTSSFLPHGCKSLPLHLTMHLRLLCINVHVCLFIPF